MSDLFRATKCGRCGGGLEDGRFLSACSRDVLCKECMLREREEEEAAMMCMFREEPSAEALSAARELKEELMRRLQDGDLRPRPLDNGAEQLDKENGNGQD